MAKEPWQEDIYENQEETRTQRHKREQGGGVIANRILTILASIFFVIVVGTSSASIKEILVETNIDKVKAFFRFFKIV